VALILMEPDEMPQAARSGFYLSNTDFFSEGVCRGAPKKIRKPRG
jgi:hypothetical protein